MATQAELRAIAKLDGRQFKGEIGKIGKKVENLGKNQLGSLKGMIAGAFSIGILVAFGRKILKTADDLQTAANIFQVSLETMIAFQSVMAESGISAERFNKIFGRIATAQGDVRRGLITYIDAIGDMNIASKEFTGIGVDEALLLMARRYGEAADKGRFMEGVAKLLGTRLVGLVEVFQRINREGMDPFIEKAKDAAGGMREMARASDALEKAQNNLTLSTARAVGGWTRLAAILGAISKVGFREAARQFRAGEFEPPAPPGRIGEPGGDIAISKAAEDEARWYKLKEESLLRQMSLLERIAYFEQDITALRERQRKSPADLGISADILEFQKKIASLKDKVSKEEESRANKLLQLNQRRDDIIKDSLEREQEILAGRGIVTPERARVDALQAIGGLVGGVAGGDQAARRFEREMKILEAVQKNLDKTNQKLDKISTQIPELAEG